LKFVNLQDEFFWLSERFGMIHVEGKHPDVSENSGIPKSSILIGFSIINHPFWVYPYFWKHPQGDSLAVAPKGAPVVTGLALSFQAIVDRAVQALTRRVLSAEKSSRPRLFLITGIC